MKNFTNNEIASIILNNINSTQNDINYIKLLLNNKNNNYEFNYIEKTIINKKI